MLRSAMLREEELGALNFGPDPAKLLSGGVVIGLRLSANDTGNNSPPNSGRDEYSLDRKSAKKEVSFWGVPLTAEDVGGE